WLSWLWSRTFRSDRKPDRLSRNRAFRSDREGDRLSWNRTFRSGSDLRTTSPFALSFGGGGCSIAITSE
ncbi:hypothetical protein, partial [Paractinoplanes deccanensis]|uniref:hypothetical protein n=1 Tax=Paractinoplanes deccanensis TaxID=113561 RepID=UPI001941ECBB